MKFNFPKIVRSFSLSEYAPELQENVFVWVNPTGKILSDLSTTFQAFMQDAEKLPDFLAVMSEILSQGEPATRWSVDELQTLITETTDTDPDFWMWFNNRVLKEISDHRLGLKKNYVPKP